MNYKLKLKRVKSYSIIIFILLLLNPYFANSKGFSFDVSGLKKLLLDESLMQKEVRKANDKLFKNIVFNLDFNLLDSVYENTNLLKTDFEDTSNSKPNDLDRKSLLSIQFLAMEYQKGKYCMVSDKYKQYLYDILHKLVPKDICDAYKFKFVFFNTRLELGATFKHNGTIILPLNTLSTPISNKESYLAFIIAHEVAHNLLYKSIIGKKKTEVECNRLACMMLKRAGFSVKILEDYINYYYLYRDVFNKGKGKRDFGFYDFYLEYSEDILKEFDLSEGEDYIVNKTLFEEFRTHCIKKSLIRISATNRHELEFNLNNTILNIYENNEGKIWQEALLESLRRMLLLKFIKPEDIAFAHKQDYLAFSKDILTDFHEKKIGIFGLIDFFNGNDDTVKRENRLNSLISYYDWFKYYMDIPNKSKDFKTIKFLYDSALSDTLKSLKQTGVKSKSVNYTFIKSQTNKLKVINEITDKNRHNDTGNTFFISEEVDESTYYGLTQSMAILKNSRVQFNTIKYLSIHTYDLFHDFNEINLNQINVWRFDSKIGIYGSAAMALIKSSTFWLGMELGFFIFSYIPFTSINNYQIKGLSHEIISNKRIKIGNKSSIKALNKLK